MQNIKELLEMVHAYYPGIRALDISQKEYETLVLKLGDKLKVKALVGKTQKVLNDEKLKSKIKVLKKELSVGDDGKTWRTDSTMKELAELEDEDTNEEIFIPCA